MRCLDESVLECQECGQVLRRLTDAEAQQVAENPENYIVFCRPCIKAGNHIQEGYR